MVSYVTPLQDTEQDSVLEDSEDNSWTEIKSSDTKDDQTNEATSVYRRKNKK